MVELVDTLDLKSNLLRGPSSSLGVGILQLFYIYLTKILL